MRSHQKSTKKTNPLVSQLNGAEIQFNRYMIALSIGILCFGGGAYAGGFDSLNWATLPASLGFGMTCTAFREGFIALRDKRRLKELLLESQSRSSALPTLPTGPRMSVFRKKDKSVRKKTQSKLSSWNPLSWFASSGTRQQKKVEVAADKSSRDTAESVEESPPPIQSAKKSAPAPLPKRNRRKKKNGATESSDELEHSVEEESLPSEEASPQPTEQSSEELSSTTQITKELTEPTLTATSKPHRRKKKPAEAAVPLAQPLTLSGETVLSSSASLTSQASAVSTSTVSIASSASSTSSILTSESRPSSITPAELAELRSTLLSLEKKLKESTAERKEHTMLLGQLRGLLYPTQAITGQPFTGTKKDSKISSTEAKKINDILGTLANIGKTASAQKQYTLQSYGPCQGAFTGKDYVRIQLEQLVEMLSGGDPQENTSTLGVRGTKLATMTQTSSLR